MYKNKTNIYVYVLKNYDMKWVLLYLFLILGLGCPIKCPSRIPYKQKELPKIMVLCNHLTNS